jgi:hypothetical protein
MDGGSLSPSLSLPYFLGYGTQLQQFVGKMFGVGGWLRENRDRLRDRGADGDGDGENVGVDLRLWTVLKDRAAMTHGDPRPN